MGVWVGALVGAAETKTIEMLAQAGIELVTIEVTLMRKLLEVPLKFGMI